MNGEFQDNFEPDFVACASALLLSLRTYTDKKRFEKCNFRKDKYFALNSNRMMNECSETKKDSEL